MRWLVIPVAGAAGAGVAIALGASPVLGLAAAALAAAVRALAGDSAAAIAGAAAGALCGIALLAGAEPRAMCAVAAAAWCIAELAKPSIGTPAVALAPACAAAILDPACAALVVLAGAHVMTAPQARPKWAPLAPVVGVLVVGAALLAGTVWHGLGRAWFGGPAHAIAPARVALAAGDALGPIAAVAAIVGLVAISVKAIWFPRRGWPRVRFAEAAVATCAAGMILASLRGGAPTAGLYGIAALGAGAAAGRLAGLVRLPIGQVVVGTVAGALVLAAPALATVAALR
ncbi:MAG TPA: hypothetical protein VGM88_07465 [Kofleriaceae bacterium]